MTSITTHHHDDPDCHGGVDTHSDTHSDAHQGRRHR